MKICGKGGAELHDMWDGEPRAYKRITFPGFPNLFCCDGPNANIVVNGIIIFFAACEVRYILGCIALLLAGERSWLDVKRDVHDAYNERLDAENERMVWRHPRVNSYYNNAAGRVTTNVPWRLIDYWKMTRRPDLADFTLR